MTALSINNSVKYSWGEASILGGTACMITSFDAPDTGNLLLSVHHGIILDYDFLKVNLPFSFQADTLKIGTLDKNFYTMETDETGDFRWTFGSFKLVLPTKINENHYRLKLKALDGYMQPGTRKVVIDINGLKRETFFDSEVKEYEFDFHIDNPKTGLIPLEISIPDWCPKDELGVNDARLLGFRFYGLEWTAVK
jgi:hypothetical protein